MRLLLTRSSQPDINGGVNVGKMHLDCAATAALQGSDTSRGDALDTVDSRAHTHV